MKNRLVLIFITILFLTGSSTSLIFFGNVNSNTLNYEILNDSNRIEPTSEEQITIIENYDFKNYNTKAPLAGQQRIAVVLAKFLDSPTRFTPAEMADLYDWVNIFWINASNGHISIDYDIYGWYDLDDSFEGYNNSGKWDKWQIAHTAIDKADNDCDFTQYDCVQVWLNNITWRCVSNVGKQTNRETNDGTINVALSIIFEKPGYSYNSILGSVTHELGHSFGLPHTHGGGSNGEKNYASYYSVMARGNPGGLNGYHMVWNGVTDWYDDTTQQEIVLPGQIKQGYIKPRYIQSTTEPQYILVKISNLIYYRIEVVEKKSEDALLTNEGVYIYLVNENEKNSDQCTDMDSTPNSDVGLKDLKDCLWNVGQSYVNTTYNVNITVLNKIGDMFEVRVVNSGSGFPDVMISPWGNPPGHPGPWESQDVWVDSIINGYNNYRYTTSDGTPVGSGDDPWANHVNKLYARVHNIGNGLAEDVNVYFYEKVPLSAGDDQDWDFIGVATVDYINAGSSAEISIPWTPEISLSNNDDGLMKLHGCIFVTIEAQLDEVDLANNKCQENIAYYEVTADSTDLYKIPSSVFKPITTTINVNNPYNFPKELFVDIINTTSKWTVQGEGLGSFTQFQPLETKEFEITIIPADEIRFTDRFNGYLIVCEEYTGADSEDFMGDIHLETVGGCSLTATVSYRSELDLEVNFRTAGLTIKGQLTFLDTLPSSKFPQTTAEKTILLEIKNTDLDVYEYYTVSIDPIGDFSYSYTILTQGNYSIKAYYAGSKYITASSSVTINVDTIHSSIWTSGKFFPGFEFYLVLAVLTITTTLIKLRKKFNFNKM